MERRSRALFTRTSDLLKGLQTAQGVRVAADLAMFRLDGLGLLICDHFSYRRRDEGKPSVELELSVNPAAQRQDLSPGSSRTG